MVPQRIDFSGMEISSLGMVAGTTSSIQTFQKNGGLATPEVAAAEVNTPKAAPIPGGPGGMGN